MEKLEQARLRTRKLREAVAARVTQTISRRALTQQRAAEQLGVTQPRISDLTRGKGERFTLDTLVEMLFALNLTVELRVNGQAIPIADSDVQHTVNHYTESLLAVPDNADALSQRARAYHQLRRYDDAIADYSRVTELQPDFPEAYANRITVFLEAGRADAALAECNELMRRFPEHNAYYARATALTELGQTEAALADLDRASTLEPKRTDVCWRRAEILEQLGRPEDAMKEYLHIMQLGVDHGAMLAADRIRQALHGNR